MLGAHAQHLVPDHLKSHSSRWGYRPLAFVDWNYYQWHLFPPAVGDGPQVTPMWYEV